MLVDGCSFQKHGKKNPVLRVVGWFKVWLIPERDDLWTYLYHRFNQMV
jgi:hypothetical protein